MRNDSTAVARAQQFWNTYVRAAHPSRVDYRVCAFGDSSQLADELLALVLARRKRATTSLARDFSASCRDIPQAGEYSILIDGVSEPRCIIRTVEVQVKPLGDVEERFAWDEGEGDRSLAWWLSAHRRYFQRQAAREGFILDDTSDVVFERFEVVWPPEFAD